MKSHINRARWLLLVGILVTSLPYSKAFWPENGNNKIKTDVFLSPKFDLGPGSVGNIYFYNVDFPRGHIALKSFLAEVVDDAGNPVPLYETYMHHWAIVRYYERKGGSENISGRNGGICQEEVLGQFFGSGSETRKTSSHVPDPYGIEVGNPADIPSGFEERWFINIHAIDVRGVEDKLGCMECWCDLYNVTVDEYGKPLSPDYKGGLLCCYDGAQCRLKQGFEGHKRSLHLKYTVTWVDMDTSILPVKIYILDVSDTWKRSNNSTGTNAEHDCKVEYDVERCVGGDDDDGCVDSKRISLDVPFSGYVIYGVAHQHTSASGSTIYREDGQPLCSSMPIYGEGEEAGNEAGYLVGMSACYPQPGSIKISKGETLILESNYSSATHHAGAMGLFHIYVADQLPNAMHTLSNVVQTQDNILLLLTILCVSVALISAVAFIAVAIRYRLKQEKEDGYDAIVM